MKKSSKGTNPCGYVEKPAKAKARIKRFEQHLECNHRLANTYANNQAGEVPMVETLTSPKRIASGLAYGARKAYTAFPKTQISREEASEVGKVMDVAGTLKTK